ncbi:helix-turn-helix transcriptional regulator [Hymenobacter qilianensis]|nr:response regulator transcription factor [Hymenobacter qilianensis]
MPAGDVLVAAPPSLHRLGLVAILRETWPTVVIRVLPGPDQLLVLLTQQRFALVIADATISSCLLPQLQQLRTHGLCPQLLVLTGRHQPLAVRHCLAQTGYPLLSRHASPTEVIQCVSGLLCPPDASSHYPTPTRRRVEPPTPFSRRELEVLRLVIADCCNQEIADRLFLSVRTVESHRRALLQKTGAKTLVGLVVQAMREGWVAA